MVSAPTAGRAGLDQYLRLAEHPHLSVVFLCEPFAACRAPSLLAAEDAAHALVEAAQKQWAVRYRGRNCDDITVVVAFLHR